MNKIVRKSIFIITMISGGFLFSQSHVLEGRILDEKDNEPLQGVIVKVNDKEAKTDASGYYGGKLEDKINNEITLNNRINEFELRKINYTNRRKKLENKLKSQ